MRTVKNVENLKSVGGNEIAIKCKLFLINKNSDMRVVQKWRHTRAFGATHILHHTIIGIFWHSASTPLHLYVLTLITLPLTH